jgi:hypothetical protein
MALWDDIVKFYFVLRHLNFKEINIEFNGSLKIWIPNMQLIETVTNETHVDHFDVCLCMNCIFLS